MENKEIIITQAGKGSATVVMPLDSYVQEDKRQLANTVVMPLHSYVQEDKRQLANTRHYAPMEELAANKISSVLATLERT